MLNVALVYREEKKKKCQEKKGKEQSFRGTSPGPELLKTKKKKKNVPKKGKKGSSEIGPFRYNLR